MDCRRFCVEACRAVGVALVAVTPGACGSPAAPSPGGPQPSPNLPPPPDPAETGSARVPPATSSVVAEIPVIRATLTERIVSIPVGPDSPLVEPWGAARAAVMLGSDPHDLLLTRTGPESFTAVRGACTHHGCLVSQCARPVFVCPCHGSRFDHAGAVVNGPANAPLQRYSTSYVDDALTVIL